MTPDDFKREWEEAYRGPVSSVEILKPGLGISTADLLAQHVTLMNRYGPDSSQVRVFEEYFCDVNPEFAELSGLAKKLKNALSLRET